MCEWYTFVKNKMKWQTYKTVPFSHKNIIWWRNFWDLIYLIFDIMVHFNTLKLKTWIVEWNRDGSHVFTRKIHRSTDIFPSLGTITINESYSIIEYHPHPSTLPISCADFFFFSSSSSHHFFYSYNFLFLEYPQRIIILIFQPQEVA